MSNQSYQINKVANGYMVQPGYSITRDRCASHDGEVYVFATMDQAGAWLAEQFGEAKPALKDPEKAACVAAWREKCGMNG